MTSSELRGVYRVVSGYMRDVEYTSKRGREGGRERERARKKKNESDIIDSRLLHTPWAQPQSPQPLYQSLYLEAEVS